jgi:hypothetical protein
MRNLRTVEGRVLLRAEDETSGRRYLYSKAPTRKDLGLAFTVVLALMVGHC